MERYLQDLKHINKLLDTLSSDSIENKDNFFVAGSISYFYFAYQDVIIGLKHKQTTCFNYSDIKKNDFGHHTMLQIIENLLYKADENTKTCENTLLNLRCILDGIKNEIEETILDMQRGNLREVV